MEENEQQALGVYRAIAAVTGDLAKQGISKDRKNQQQGYAFRGIEDVYHALAPLLVKHGLVITAQCSERSEDVRETARGGSLYSVKMRVRFTLSALDGSATSAIVYGEGMDSADKATNKAMSAAYKYMAFMTFCIPTDAADDGDRETPEPTVRKVKPRAAKPAPSKAAAAVGLAHDGEPYETFDEAMRAIGGAMTNLELEMVGARLGLSGFESDEHQWLTSAYRSRMGWLAQGNS